MISRQLPLAVAAVWFGTISLHAQETALLRELPAVGVHIVGVTPSAAKLGIDSVDLQRRSEQTLRAAGFVVPAGAELREHPETPLLIVNLGVFTTPDSNAVLRVALELLEPVQLMRNGLATHAIGWSEEVMGFGPAVESAAGMRAAVDHLLEMFLSQAREATLGMR
jgi:hypothetical protein